MANRNKPASKRQQKKINAQNRRSVGRAGPVPQSNRTIAPLSSTSRDSAFFEIQTGPSKYKNSVLLRGRDLMAQVSAGATAPTAGEALYNGLIDAIDAFSGTRLARFFALYEKFLFKRLRFHWKPACSAETDGQIMIAYDRDPSDATPVASFHGLQQYAAMEGSASTAPWTALSVDCPLSDSQDFYYTNEAITGVNDERLFAQGQIYVVASTDFGAGVVNKALGTLWCDWECVLFDPQLEDLDTEIVHTRVVPGDTAVPTTQNAAWNAILSGTTQKVGNGASWGNGFDGVNAGLLLPRGTWDITWVMPTTATNTFADMTANVLYSYDAKTKENLVSSLASYVSSGINTGAASVGMCSWKLVVDSLAGAWVLASSSVARKRGGGTGEYVKAVKVFDEYIED